MLRWVLVLTLAACTPEDAPLTGASPPSWVYPPPPPSWQHGELRGRLGRSQMLQRPRAGGVVGELRVPLRRPQVWAVPGIGPARAVVYGFEGVRPAVELIDVEAGTLLWRETATCAAPVVGVTAEAIVCGGASGVRALGLDGKPRWQTDARLIGMTGDRVVADAGEAVILAASSGERVAAMALPDPLALDMLVGVCGDELFALGSGGRLVRLAAGKPKWATLLGAIEAPGDGWGRVRVECGPSILVSTGDALIAIDHANGKVTGRVDGVRGYWPARDDSERIEVATGAEVLSRARDLAGEPVAIDLPPLGPLLAARGDRRLVRVDAGAVALLDRAGVYAYLALAADRAVIGGTAVLAGSTRGPGETVHRLVLPERTRRVLRVPARGRGLAVPAELRDLPEPGELDVARAFAQPDTGKHGIAAAAIDPREPAVIYAVALDEEAGEASRAVLAAADLGARAWRWQRGDGCGPGVPLALALADGIVACAARGVTTTVRATSRTGAARWDLEVDAADALAGAGDTLVVFDAGRLTVLDAATGRVRGRLASDGGAPMPAAVVPVGEVTWLVTAEAGKLVARVPVAGMIGVWSLAVDGHVRALAPSGTGVLVELADGDAYRVDVATAKVTAIPGIDLAWRADGDLVTGHTVGGPIPGIPLPRVAAPPPRFPPNRVRRPPRPDDRNPDPPTLWVPIEPPPPLGDSWQYTLYELDGGLRARNDYALAAPVAPSEIRGPQGSPLVVAYGAGLREALVLDPRTGDPVKRVRLPDGARVFGTIVEGTPVAGALLAGPLRAVVF